MADNKNLWALKNVGIFFVLCVMFVGIIAGVGTLIYYKEYAIAFCAAVAFVPAVLWGVKKVKQILNGK